MPSEAEVVAGTAPADVHPTNNFAAKWLLNGFPKAGLHLAVSLMSPVAKIMPAGPLREIPWVGTYHDHSWSLRLQNPYIQLYHLSALQPGHYYKAHAGWSKEWETVAWYLGIAHVFCYRDLRDVAVSAAHHILDSADDGTGLNHPGRHLYGDKFEHVLDGVICGVDRYPGVVERWNAYAGWLGVPWVYTMRFEDAMADLESTAKGLIRYGLNRLGSIFQIELRVSSENMAAIAGRMATAAREHRHAITFRKGEVGGWRDAFRPRHIEMFQETDTDNWLHRLGYSW